MIDGSSLGNIPQILNSKKEIYYQNETKQIQKTLYSQLSGTMRGCPAPSAELLLGKLQFVISILPNKENIFKIAKIL